jgi:hypothetical protein
MTATQLRLLAILSLELITDAIQQLDVALVGILLESINKRPRHGTRGLSLDRSIGTTVHQSAVRHCTDSLRYLRSLRILGTTPHDNICRARLGAQVLLVHRITLCNLLEHTTGSRKHATEIILRVA